MSAASVTRYVVTFHYPDQSLSDLQELNSAMSSGGFTTTLVDEAGHPHELGSNSFGLVSALTREEIAQQATAVGEMVLNKTPDVEVTTLDDFLKQQG